MIDFPNAPADQQIFNGPNGVVYQWIAASGLWKALGVGTQSVIVSDTAPASPYNGMLWWNSLLGQMFISYTDPNSQQWVPTSTPASQMLTTPGGDFCAYYSTPPAMSATVTVGMPNVIYSGNANGAYNPSNGRWTPPPGRYFLTAGFMITANSGLAVNLRKNGANLAGGSLYNAPFAAGGQVPANAGWWGDPQATAIVDANGTDYFDFTFYSGTAGTSTSAWFMAFPLSGIQGPQGGPGPAGSPVTAAFNIRNTATDTWNGAATGTVFRSLASPVKDYDLNGVITLANNCRFTAPTDGRYNIEFFAYCLPNAGCQLGLVLQHTNVAGALVRNYGDYHYCDNTGYASTFHVAINEQMLAGEKIDFLLGIATANSVQVVPSGGYISSALTYAFGHRIG